MALLIKGLITGGNFTLRYFHLCFFNTKDLNQKYKLELFLLVQLLARSHLAGRFSHTDNQS